MCWLLCSPVSGRPRPAILSCFTESRKAARIMVANVGDSETWVSLPPVQGLIVSFLLKLVGDLL